MTRTTTEIVIQLMTQFCTASNLTNIF